MGQVIMWIRAQRDPVIRFSTYVKVSGLLGFSHRSAGLKGYASVSQQTLQPTRFQF